MILLLLLLLAYLCWAILAELERSKASASAPAGDCPGCRQTVEADWLLCPSCLGRLREPCPCCGERRAVWHRFCPFCGGHSEVTP